MTSSAVDHSIDRRRFAITGMPRSGTTYVAAVLYNPPSVVTLSENRGGWRRMYSDGASSNDLGTEFDRYYAKLRAGVPVHTLEGTPGFMGDGRVDTWNQKKNDRIVPVAPEFVLGMKNPLVFIAWLPLFQQSGMRCVVSVRHPVAILNSWARRLAEQAEKRGSSGKWSLRNIARLIRRADDGQENSFGNGRSLVYASQAPDPASRRIDLHNHLAQLIIDASRFDNVMLVRHEDWYSDPGQLARVAGFLGIPHLGRLRPAPIPADPITLPASEQDRILRECVCAEAFGYPVRDGVLLPPAAPERTG